MKTSVAIC